MKPVNKRVLIGIVGLSLIPVLYIAFWIWALIPPYSSFARWHEKLPAVSIEIGDTVYCRMWYCDFRFPLPEQARIVQTDPVTGGPDTIHGAIYVVGPDGAPVNMRAYAEWFQKHHFDADPGDGSGCSDVTNNMPDVPFISGGRVIHYPLFDSFSACSKNQEGGLIIVERNGPMTKISFSYFGDY